MSDLGAVGILFDPMENFISQRLSGVVLDDNGNPASRRVIAVANSGFLQPQPHVAGFANSNAQSGEYEISCGVNSARVSVICQDDDGAPALNDLVLRVVP